MGTEIERKFWVKGLSGIVMGAGVAIKQGYLRTRTHTVIRVRVFGGQGFLAVKGENRGAVRAEFEYPIPVSDANQMLSELCERPFIDKIRHTVEHAGLTWEIDVFNGENEGLVLAEVELESETQQVVLPSWIGAEVTCYFP